MLTERLGNNLRDWDFPTGPFESPADVTRAMTREAEVLGPQAAPELVQAIVALDSVQYQHIEVVYEFIEIYAALYPQALEAAILRQLTNQGPPILVDLLGTTGSAKAVQALASVIDPTAASEELAVALAGALGEIGGPQAQRWLQEWQQRNPAQTVASEIAIALSGNGRQGRYPG